MGNYEVITTYDLYTDAKRAWYGVMEYIGDRAYLRSNFPDLNDAINDLTERRRAEGDSE